MTSSSFFRHGVLRPLKRDRLSNAVVVVSLAVGVGGSAAMLRAFDSLWLQGPPYVRDPSSVVVFRATTNYVAYQTWAASTRSMTLGAFTRRPASVRLQNATRTLIVECVSSNFFSALGAPLVKGRAFLSEDEPVAVMRQGHDLDGGIPGADVIGGTVRIGAHPYTVVGIAPAGFTGVELDRVDAWIPIRSQPSLCSFTGTDLLTSSSGAWLRLFGRLNHGTSLQDAEAEMSGVVSRASAAAPQSHHERVLDSVSNYRWARLGTNRNVLLAAAASAALVLLICCANASSILVARSLGRSGESSTLVQLGATHGDLVAYRMLEAATLGAIGGILAVAIAGGVARGMANVLALEALAGDTDLLLLLIVALITPIAALLSGIPASLHALLIRTDRVSHSLHIRGAGRPWPQRLLVMAEIGMSIGLLSACGLIGLSLRNLERGAGVNLDNTLVVTYDRSSIPASDASMGWEDLRERIGQLPVIESAAISLNPVFGSGGASIAIPVHSAEGSKENSGVADLNAVSDNYFRTVGTAITSGREFNASDRRGAPLVAVASSGLASRLWPEGAIGQCAHIARLPCITIVGVSQQRRYRAITKAQDELFIPLTQSTSYIGDVEPAAIIVRPRVAADKAIAAIQRLGVAGLQVRTLLSLANRQTRTWRLGFKLFGLFSVIALFLAGLGVHALLTLLVQRRRSEIGVRLALGGTPVRVAGCILRESMALTAGGVLVGFALIAWGLPLLRRLLFDIGAADPVVWSLSGAVVVAAISTGSAVPTFRLLRISPASALRDGTI